MSNNKIILNFLAELSENNSKEWMDKNRSKYSTAKEYWLQEVKQILAMLCKHDNHYFSIFEPKDCISRITNNRVFNPELPIYKTHFTFTVMDKKDMFSPLHVSIGNDHSFVGCGYHNPDKGVLANIRAAIDYDGATFQSILENKAFKTFFGGLDNFMEPLKTSPKGYPNTHPFVEYLRYKNFVVSRSFTKDEINGKSFHAIIEKAYLLSIPFRQYLQQANSV